MLRIASCVVSACAAVFILGVSLAFYASALAEWAQGNLDKLNLLFGVFLSLSSIGVVAIQTSVERCSKRITRVICVVLGGMGSLAVACFSVYFFKPVHRHLDKSAVVVAIFFALASLASALRTYYVLGPVRVATRP